MIEAELVAVEDEIAAHERMVHLEALARDEHERREAEEAERQRHVEQERDQRAAERALEQREEALRALWRDLQNLGGAVGAFLEVEAEAERAYARAGRRLPSRRQAAAELVCIACRDAGLTDEPIGFVRASVRASVLAPYLSQRVEVAREPTISTCSICSHPERESLESALAAGASYRETAATFGVSRSAICRHAKHA
jgi:hypothetical protein